MSHPIHITDFVAIPEDFIIEDHLRMREKMGFFNRPDLVTLELVNKTNAVVKTTGFLQVTYTLDAGNYQEEMQSVASAAAYLMCLDELGLIVESFKKFSFKTIWGKGKQEAFESFLNTIVDNDTRVAVHIVNIFPLIQNRKFYLEDAVQALLKLDDIDLDQQDTSEKIGNLD
jgi:hypothetical protein